jgi:hypothetical protein
MAYLGDPQPTLGRASPRIVTIVLGAWLAISAFLWPHTEAQRVNAWAIGMISVVSGLVALAVPVLRYVTTALAVWLFITAWAMPGVTSATTLTTWNNLLVAIVMLLASLAPSGTEATRYHGGRHA